MFREMFQQLNFLFLIFLGKNTFVSHSLIFLNKGADREREGETETGTETERNRHCLTNKTKFMFFLNKKLASYCIFVVVNEC